MEIKQVAKSRTVQFNAVVPLIMVALSAFGVSVPVEAVTGILALGNFILRLITKEPINAK